MTMTTSTKETTPAPRPRKATETSTKTANGKRPPRKKPEEMTLDELTMYAWETTYKNRRKQGER